MGLTVRAKAASDAWLNGNWLGSNGLPASTADAEIPGAMDTVFGIDPGAMREGLNQVAIRMSSHHGFLTLQSPLHGVYIAPFIEPTDWMMRGYWPSILPFGMFVLSALYFTIIAASARRRVDSSLVAVMSTCAGTQLMFEVSRGITAYTYPFHDIRLMVILVCSTLFGLCLMLLTTRRFQPKRAWVLAASVAIITALTVSLGGGFDLMTRLALLIPTIASVLVALSALRRDRGVALLWCAVLTGFAVINVLGATLFLDQYFYFAIAVLILFLTSQQARALTHEEHLRLEAQSQADRLQFALDSQHGAVSKDHLSITAAGKITRIAVDDIAFVRGAGDYSELVTEDGPHLHNATLSELEGELPAYFLRVHRSYLVNTKQIRHLDRNPSGTGSLSLSGGDTVPVSRRIMPHVKAVLREAL